MNYKPTMIPDHHTPENLAVWIKEHSVERNKFTVREDYDDDEIVVLEHRLSDRTIELENILGLKADAVKHFADGTEETTINIPETIGIKSLKESISSLASKIDLGYSERTLDIYGIPFSEDKQIVFVDIEGNKTGPARDMNDVEIEKFTGPLFDGVAEVEFEDDEKLTEDERLEVEKILGDGSDQKEMQKQMDEGNKFEEEAFANRGKEAEDEQDEPQEIDTQEFPDMDKKIEDDNTF